MPRICPHSFLCLGAAYVPILLSEVEQDQRPSGNGDREPIVVGSGLCDCQGERAYTVYDLIIMYMTLYLYYSLDVIPVHFRPQLRCMIFRS